MTIVNRLLMAAMFLLAAPALAGGNDASPSAFELTLHREACFGTCPMYTVKVDGNGSVDWSGERWVKQTGQASKLVNPSTVNRLKRAVQQANFFALKDEYTAMSVSDLPYASLDIRQGSQRKTARWHLGDPSAPPPPLELAKQTDPALGTSIRIGKR